MLTPRQITQGGRIIMIQLDNEMGRPQWVRNILDVNPDTIARFAEHLQNTYGSQLPNRYPTDNLADFLREGILHPAEPYAANIVADYRDFYRDYLFDEVFATRANGETVGFSQTVGKGKVMLFAAAIPADTLEDVDLVHQIALRMDCPSLFQLSEWADTRLSQGDKGSFFFINNYQDDPVAPTITYENEMLLDSNPICLPARRGLILPLDWQINDRVTLHYSTAEITDVTDNGSTLTLKTEPAAFVAELTFSGYQCEGTTIIQESAGKTRLKLPGKEGMIVLRKIG